MFICYFVYTNHQVLLICNENRQNVCCQFDCDTFPLADKYSGVTCVLNGLSLICLPEWSRPMGIQQKKVYGKGI